MVVMAGWLLHMFLPKCWFQNNYPRLAQSIIVKSMTWCTYVWVVLKCFDFQDSFEKLFLPCSWEWQKTWATWSTQILISRTRSPASDHLSLLLLHQLHNFVVLWHVHSVTECVENKILVTCCQDNNHLLLKMSQHWCSHATTSPATTPPHTLLCPTLH